jgi:hypothetical protein
MADTIDTRDLIAERDELKETILREYNIYFDDDLDSFDDIEFSEDYERDFRDECEDPKDIFTKDWIDELNAIREIDDLESEIGRDFEYGCTLIPEEEFEDYCIELLEELGYIPKDFPSWIVVDYTATADNMEQDYTEVEFRGETYLYRA